MEADLGERPATTFSEGREHLRGVAGLRVSVEGRGCELLHLPPYSSDLFPIEKAFAKLEGHLGAAARSRS